MSTSAFASCDPGGSPARSTTRSTFPRTIGTARGLARSAQLVFAVAEEHEIVPLEPFHERSLLRRAREAACGLARPLAHRRPVVDRGAHLRQHDLELTLDIGQRFALSVDLRMDDGLA